MPLIVADTTCGIPRDVLAARGVPLIPQIVIFGEDSLHDDKELDTAAFLQKLKASKELPKTAAPEAMLYHPIFQAAQEKNESVIVVAPSAKLSGTVRSAQDEAQIFANELKSRVAVPNIQIYELPPAIVVHAGPKAMGVGFFV